MTEDSARAFTELVNAAPMRCANHDDDIRSRVSASVTRLALLEATRERSLALAFERSRCCHPDLIASRERGRADVDAAVAGVLALRREVRAYVQFLRDVPTRVETIIVLLRDGLRNDIRAMPASERFPEPSHVDRQIIQWAITAYYEAA